MSKPDIAQKSPIPIDVTEGASYWWCACGKSNNQPFCDGSHKGSEFRPLKYDAVETGKKFFCGCKQTLTSPFCDGTHKQLE